MAKTRKTSTTAKTAKNKPMRMGSTKEIAYISSIMLAGALSLVGLSYVAMQLVVYQLNIVN